MRYEVDVTIPRPLDEATARFLEAVCRSANRVSGFRGDGAGIHLTVEVSGMCRDDAVRSAVREVAGIFPGRTDGRFGEPREHGAGRPAPPTATTAAVPVPPARTRDRSDP
jgi:hypothetical protein